MQKIWMVRLSEIDTFYTREILLKNLPKVLTERAYRYVCEESAQSYIVGRLLLKKALVENNLSTSLLEEIHYSEQGKPSLKDLYFSISHSKGYVVLVFGTNFSVGIDIEYKKDIDLKLFKYLFTKKEWKIIVKDENPIERFFWYWVRKESLLKAVGCTLKDLKYLNVSENSGSFKSKHYYFKAFDFDVDFNGVVAVEEEVEFELEYITLTELLK